MAAYRRAFSSNRRFERWIVAESMAPRSAPVLCLCSPSSTESAAERFLKFLLCAVEILDLDLSDRIGAVDAAPLAELEMREARLLENAREVDEDISLAFVFDNCLIPYRLSALSVMVETRLQ